MAMKPNGKRFCKVVYTENGRNRRREIHIVQSTGGELHPSQERTSHRSISFDGGVPNSGEHLVEMLLSPKNANSFLSTDGWLSKRDVFFMVLGVFFLRLINFLADEAALALM